ncbi:MAG: efflux RND transporter permease subunit [Polyangiaceae bacterium]|nr:efflux RND transporter permease subunit [Polyangiaceae bacterium]
MSKFFIDRPIFAWVIALVIMIAGTLSIVRLPVAQYPAIAPPVVSISATFPGASAQTVEATVTQVIEQRMTGLDGLRYISSSSDSTGNALLELTFEPGTDPDIAQVQVQNKLALATPQLPQEVQRQGVQVAKSNRNYLLIAAFVSEDGSMQRNDIADYVVSSVLEPISRVHGVGEVQAFGSQYAMRIWLDPDKLTSFQLTPIDVRNAIAAQNAQVSAGQFGGTPSIAGQELNATITAQTRLETPEQFAAILLKVNRDGSRVRLADVGRIELTGENADVESFLNGNPSAGMAIRLAAGANALDTADAVRKRLDELSKGFPEGLKVRYVLDSTPFVRISIRDVVKTLAEAVGLVFVVMLLFLQSVRATIIPTIAVPVVLLGTFGILSAAGFSINTLTMFGMVLAIGLLVDDAIVVVENVERVMHEENLPPKEATKKSMQQITGALVGIATVLMAVFIPMAFFGGSVGAIYRQFSITLVSAMALSVFVALTLTPALCATILRPERTEKKKGFFGAFNRVYDRTNAGYGRSLRRLVRHRGVALLVYVGLCGALALLFLRMPTGFIPDEDQGTLTAQILLPPGSTIEQTREVTKQVSDYLLTEEGAAVEEVYAVNGYAYVGRGQSSGLAFIKLRDWDQRKDKHLRADAVASRTTAAFAKIRTAQAFTIVPPAIPELGNVGGFQLQIEDRAGLGHQALVEATNKLIEAASNHPALTKVRQGGLVDRPEYKVEVDEEKASALGLSIADINTTLSAAWGASYINDFLDRGRTKRVFMQADAPFRMLPGDLGRWYVRNAAGEMVPFSAFAAGQWKYGSPKLDRFNGFSTIAIQGEASPGHSSGEAMAAMEELAKQLPEGMAVEWSGVSYEERAAGAGAGLLYAISLVFVFLCLAALYESWSIPISVLLVVPLGVLGAVIATFVGKTTNDVYFQVGLLATIGLAAKNAILIVEFAKEIHEKGAPIDEAALEAARLRLRPIVMTSLAFGLGVLPMALASGAGAAAQNAIGNAVAGGVIAATVLGVMLVPVFFVVVTRLTQRRKKKDKPPTQLSLPLKPAGAPGGGHG